MNPRLLENYAEELTYLRDLGGEFALRFPAIAGRLGLQGGAVAPDPNVERLIESAAFLAARVRLKLDAEFPRFAERLLDMLYPGYLAPLPSMVVAQLVPDPADPRTLRGSRVPRGASLQCTRPPESGDVSIAASLRPEHRTRCEFRTAHEVDLAPIEVASARHMSSIGDVPLTGVADAGRVRSVIQLRLCTVGGTTFDAIEVERLRFHLGGSDEVAGRLHEAITSAVVGVVVAPAGSNRATAALSPRCVVPTGLEDDEALLPMQSRVFQGHRLLQEYFAFPHRFLFFRIDGIGAALRAAGGREVDLFLLLDRAEPTLTGRVDAADFLLHCVPAINLFPRRAERILVDGSAHRFHVVPDRARPLDFEVFDILAVTGLDANGAAGRRLRPLHEASYHDESHDEACFSVDRELRLASRDPAHRHGRPEYVGSEVHLSMVDARDRPARDDLGQLSVRALCTNRGLPLAQRMDGVADFTLDQPAPVLRTRCVRGPTRPRSRLAATDASWLLLSQLSLNHLSLLGDSPAAVARTLQSVLAVNAPTEDPALLRQIEGVLGLRTAPTVRRVPAGGPLAFARGVSVELTLDDAAFAGTGPMLLAAVIERFLARHASINAFTAMTLRTPGRGVVHHWPPRSGKHAIF